MGSISADFRANLRSVEDFRVVQTLSFLVINSINHLEEVAATNHFIDIAEA